MSPSVPNAARWLAAAVLAAGVAGCATPKARPRAAVPGERAMVVVVRGTESAPSAAEQRVAAQCAERVTRWLGAAGITCRVLDDEAAAAGHALDDAAVVVLPYNPKIPHPEFAALRRFVTRGGRLVVCYSSDPHLADLMGVKLGRYASGGGWSAFRFLPGAPPHLPPRVEQRSGNILPVTPVAPGGRVLAVWEDSDGKALADPAWVETDRGLWMTHVLLEDDPAGKQRLLLGLVGHLAPGVWPQAARHRLATTVRLGAFATRAEARRQIAALAERAAQEPRVRALLSQADVLETRLQDNHRKGLDARAIEEADAAEMALTEAYACAQAPRPGEFRGVWNHSGTGLYPGDWPRTCRVLRQAGFTAVFPHVQRPHEAHYRSRVIPASRELQRYGDQLAQCTAAARLQGLEVHAWVICWNLEGADEAFLQRLRRQDRLQVSAAGEPLPWLCPSHPDNLAYELDGIRELARGYPVDGVHLDYIRFKSADYCFCAGCRTRFQRDTGLRVRQWPADVRAGPLAPAWREWRRGLITRLVTQARRELQALPSRPRLSAAVYRNYPGVRESIAQDWGAWLERGDLDFACPMNYTEEPARFAAVTAAQLALPGAAGRVYPGIGVTSLESRLDASETIRQILLARQALAPGFMLFDLNPRLEKDILPLLALGVTAER
jgi:uncharacterized lipoprotein YddW (UPF0748 family)